MIESATGIVLRTQRFSETSLIVRWLTADAGRVSTLAKGARRAASPLAGRLDLLIRADFTFSRSRRSDLHTLRELNVLEYHQRLRREVEALQVAAYCTALLEQTTESDTPLPGVFDLFSGLLQQLSVDRTRPRWVLAFEVKLLEVLGLAPSPAHTRLRPPSRELLSSLIREDWPGIGALQPAAGTVKELNAFLRGFLEYHLGGLPKSRGDTFRAVSP
jgi:DNA repair protein RecO (recombination protein O)